ncbi:MAG: hydrogenase maturation protease [Candidatus Marinimicrobia bacterium]|nr:hydrogenase maturation protease [Candidatus Neomarinimicrobiota bacterium]
MRKPLIVGFGNVLYGDDGVGEVVIERLKECKEVNKEDVVFAGTDGLILFNLVERNRPLIIVDAVKMGTKPGTIRKFELDSVRLNTMVENLSTHSFGLSELVGLIEGSKGLGKVTVIGVEPKRCRLGELMSQEVTKSVDKVIELVMREYKLYE